MDDMKRIVEETKINMGKYGEKFTEKMKGFTTFHNAMMSDGALDKKSKELIAISLGVVQSCEWCIGLHVKKALELGATEEEINEAAWVAVLMGGGPALMHFQIVEKALDDFKS